MEFDFIKMRYALVPSTVGALVRGTIGIGCGMVPLNLLILAAASIPGITVDEKLGSRMAEKRHHPAAKADMYFFGADRSGHVYK